MSRDTLTVALVTDVFTGPDAETRLVDLLREAQRRGADLAVLPELPFLPWVPASRRARDGDAEPPDGPSVALLRRAATAASLAVLGGAIVRDASGRRFNSALLVDRRGALRATTRKTHVPAEEGWWESAHYDQGDDLPAPVDGAPWPLTVQICSDAMRPAGVLAAAAAGARVVVVPRATPPSSLWRWSLVLRTIAITGCVWIVSVNRPAEAGTEIGGPSLVVDPFGTVEEAGAPLHLATLDGATTARAGRGYPGSLDVRADLYSGAWLRVAEPTGR